MISKTRLTELVRAGSLFAALLVPVAVLPAQTIPNPSFEVDTFTTFPGYISGAGNGPITGWTGLPVSRVGLNPAGSSPFADNGAVPDGANVAFVQNGDGTSTLSTSIGGLTAGQRYRVLFRINARGGNAPYLQFSTDSGDPPLGMEVTAVGGSNAYRHASVEFTASATEQVMTLRNIRPTGDHTVLVDHFQIIPSDGAWAIAPWTGDADSGVDPQYTYTHAVNFGTNAGVTINDVPFIGRETSVAGRFVIGGLGSVFGNRTPNFLTGASAALAKDFRYGGVPSIRLENLKPNTEYVFTLYGLGFDEFVASGYPYRTSTFSSNVPGSQRFTADLDTFGLGNGARVTYRYTTDGVGTPVTIDYPATGTGTFHSSAFSNRETTPNVTPSPWSAVAWTDDATSGIDSTFQYTHAYNFGTGNNVHVNGVNFTGIAGGNPGAVNLSTGVPTVGPVDTNAISGFGVALGTNFLFNGFPARFTLDGLTPGMDYVLTLYTVGWEPGARWIKFFGNTGEGGVLINQNVHGDNVGNRIEYRYTAPASGSLTVHASAYADTFSFHPYALSNREAAPLVDAAPVITLQPQGASVAEGLPFTLRAGAAGSATLRYQWSRNGEELVGETLPVLMFDSIGFDQAGDYTCKIENSVDDVITNTATIVVLNRIPGLFNTGVGIDGQLLPHGAVDPHYSLLINPEDSGSMISLVQGIGIPGAWVANSATSSWIGPRANTSAAAGIPTDAGGGPGVYVYRTRFDLTGFDLASVQITGNWSSDNAGIRIRVNGEETSFTNLAGSTFSNLLPFAINQATVPGLLQGENLMDFVVENSAVGFTGLRVQGMNALGVIPPGTAPHIAVQPQGVAVPTGGTLLLSVAANGSHPLRYEWFVDGKLIDGEGGSVLKLEGFNETMTGNYTARAINAVDDADSETAVVSLLNTAPSFPGYAIETPYESAATVSVNKLLATTTDVDGDTFAVTAVSPASAAGGPVVLGVGGVLYTPPAEFSGADSFQVTVTDSRGGSSIGNVSVTVSGPFGVGANPPAIVMLPNGDMRIRFQVIPGRTYQLQRSTGLEDWVTIANPAAAANGLLEFTDGDPPVPSAFYRLRNP